MFNRKALRYLLVNITSTRILKCLERDFQMIKHHVLSQGEFRMG